MIYTKKDLIGRKFVTNNGKGTIHEIFDNPHPDFVDIILENRLISRTRYSVYTLLSFIDGGTNDTWLLLPIEPTIYTTPKGLKYGIGTRFTVKEYTSINTITAITKDRVYVEIPTYKTSYVLNNFSEFLDSWEITLIPDTPNNQMKEVIEVGDVWKNKYLNITYTITEVTESNVRLNQSTPRDSKEWLRDKCELVSKANKQQIIGYELLKDLPGIPAGTKSIYIKVTNSYSFSCGIVSNTFSPEQTKDTIWFKPIYKAKEVIVKISGSREVKVTSQYVSLSNKEFFDTKNVEEIHEFVNKQGKVIFNTPAPYPVIITAIKVGCQEFTKEDINLVYESIKNIK